MAPSAAINAAAPSDKSSDLSVQHAIQVRQNFCWFADEAIAQRADNGADRHRRFQPFTAHIAHYNEQRSILAGRYVKEISAHFAGGKIDALDVEARRARRSSRN